MKLASRAEDQRSQHRPEHPIPGQAGELKILSNRNKNPRQGQGSCQTEGRDPDLPDDSRAAALE